MESHRHRGMRGRAASTDPELHELVDPFTVLRVRAWPDSAGAGEWRGGIGTIYRWRIDTNEIAAANFGGGVHEVTAPFGLEGGKPAPPHRLSLHKGNETIKSMRKAFTAWIKAMRSRSLRAAAAGDGDPLRRRSSSS